MKNLIILSAVLLLVISCKGPKSGPLQNVTFNETNLSQDMKQENYMANISSEKIDIAIEPCEECITISSLIENKKSYSGKLIRVKGQVTKFNPEIMGRNWVHIQDGSEYRDQFDITVTTDSEVSVGDTVIFEGKIALDKDFGYGYVYQVLMEEGKPVL